MFGNSADDWNTYPNRRFSGGTTFRPEAENSVVPMTVICPLSGRVRPAMQFRSVVLPLPDGPNTEVAPVSNVTSQSNVNCGNRLVTAICATGAGHAASGRGVFASSQLCTTSVATAMAMAMAVSSRAVESSRRMTAE